jgi:hypothetical protein
MGKLDELLEASGDTVATFKAQMIQILATLGYVVRLHPLKLAKLLEKKGRRRGEIVMGPLPASVEGAVDQFRQLARDALMRLLHGASGAKEEVRALLQTATLPATREDARPVFPMESALDTASEAGQELLSLSSAPRLRTTYSAMAGRGDAFADVIDVVENVMPLPGLHPSVFGDTGQRHRVNAYIYDFWTHGQVSVDRGGNQGTVSWEAGTGVRNMLLWRVQVAERSQYCSQKCTLAAPMMVYPLGGR